MNRNLRYSGEWHDAVINPPKQNGTYLVFCSFHNPSNNYYGCCRILRFAKDLYRVDRYDFGEYKEKRRAGWYDYDSEWGYVDYHGVMFWTELPNPPYIERN